MRTVAGIFSSFKSIAFLLIAILMSFGGLIVLSFQWYGETQTLRNQNSEINNRLIACNANLEVEKSTNQELITAFENEKSLKEEALSQLNLAIETINTWQSRYALLEAEYDRVQTELIEASAEIANWKELNEGNSLGKKASEASVLEANLDQEAFPERLGKEFHLLIGVFSVLISVGGFIFLISQVRQNNRQRNCKRPSTISRDGTKFITISMPDYQLRNYIQYLRNQSTIYVKQC